MAAYIVEAILDHEERKDGMYYYVKWKGYDNPKDNTWEPENSFMKPFILLDEYKSKYLKMTDSDSDEDEEGCRVVENEGKTK